MSLSKRTRFEVLRRDNHTCQYCGQVAPDVILHVDHVIPVSLGGNDTPSNLVAACKDCNAGKASISPDSPFVAALGERSAEWALALANRSAHIQADIVAAREYVDQFDGYWDDAIHDYGVLPRPDDWERTIETWWRTFVPMSLLEKSIRSAMQQTKVYRSQKFTYFCGIVWRTLDYYDARYPGVENEGPVYGPDDMEARAIESYYLGCSSVERQMNRAGV